MLQITDYHLLVLNGLAALKREIAESLGYGAKIKDYGWGELTSVEAGKIGGLVTSYMKKHQW